MKKVAVVIPAYNAAETVERTVRSVMASTIPLEVWVVDDGSTDGTSAILEGLRKELELHVIHQENCGAYQARLNALKQIRTPYFGFVDADDTVEPTMFEKMLALAEKEQLDVVQCDWEWGEVKSKGEKVKSKGEGVIEGPALEKYKYGYLVNPKESCFIWDKLYRNQYDFAAFEPTDHVTNFDDMIFNFQFFRKIRRIGFLSERLYHYEAVATSAVHSFGPRQKHDFKWMVKNHFRLCRALFPNGEFSSARLWLGHLLWRTRNTRNVLLMILKGKSR